MQKDTKKIIVAVLTIIIAVAMTVISMISDQPLENLFKHTEQVAPTAISSVFYNDFADLSA